MKYKFDNILARGRELDEGGGSGGDIPVGYEDVTSVDFENKKTFTGNIPNAIIAPSNKYYSIEKGVLTVDPIAGTATLDFTPYLVYEGAATFTGTWRVLFAAGGKFYDGQDIITLTTSTTITPGPGVVYKRNLQSGDTFTIDTSALTANKQITFELCLTQPSTAVAFTPPANLMWPDGDTFKSTTAPPVMMNANTTYVLVIRWNGNRLLINKSYAIEEASE